jgi:hypothetical protein
MTKPSAGVPRGRLSSRDPGVDYGDHFNRSPVFGRRWFDTGCGETRLRNHIARKLTQYFSIAAKIGSGSAAAATATAGTANAGNALVTSDRRG